MTENEILIEEIVNLKTGSNDNETKEDFDRYVKQHQEEVIIPMPTAVDENHLFRLDQSIHSTVEAEGEFIRLDVAQAEALREELFQQSKIIQRKTLDI